MLCHNCGTQLADSVRFCTACGMPVTADAEPAPTGSEVPNSTDPAAKLTADSPAQEQAASEPPNSEKRKRKKAIIALVCIVLALSLAVLGTLYALVWNTAEVRLTRAYEKTREAFHQIFAPCDTLEQFGENLQALYEAQEFTGEAALSFARGDAPETAAEFRLHYSLPQKRLSGEAQLDDYRMTCYGEEERLAFGLPGLLKDTYYFPLKTFGEDLYNSTFAESLGLNVDAALRELSLDLFEDTSWAAFRDAHDEEIDAFLRSLTIASSDRTIPHDGQSLTVYAVQFDWDVATRLAFDYLDHVVQARFGISIPQDSRLRVLLRRLAELDAELLVGVNDDGYLSAACLLPETGDSLTLLLAGKANPWNEIELYDNDDLLLSAGLAHTGSELSFSLKAMGRELRIEVNDADGEIRLLRDGEAFLTLSYGAAEDGVQLRLPIEGENLRILLELELRPLEEVAPFPDEPINLLALDMTDLQKILTELMLSLWVS